MFTKQRAVENFVAEAITFQRGPVTLVASASICFLMAPGDDQRDVRLEMFKALETANLKPSTVSKYVGIGQELAAKLADTEIFKSITDQRSPTLAETTLLDWLADKDMDTVDALADYVGKYRRTPRQATAAAEDTADHSTRAPADAPEDEHAPNQEDDSLVDTVIKALHTLRLQHDKDGLLRIQNVIADELMTLERSEKRRSRGVSRGDGKHAAANS